MLSCKEVSNLVSKSLDHRLSLIERLRVRLHLLMCNMCTRYARQITFISNAAKKLLASEASRKLGLELSDEARERIGQTIKQHVTSKDRS